MPFKSQAQRAMFYARAKNDPKWKRMAKKWSAHTPDGKLPKKVGENFGDGNSDDDIELNGHEGFEVQDFHQDKDPLGMREAPRMTEVFSIRGNDDAKER